MNDTAKEKVLAIFRELTGERAHQLEVGRPEAAQIISQALAVEHLDRVAHDIAFHLTDWQIDAAFIVAIILYPERFTPEEIREGIEGFIVHAPNHTAAVAKLAGWPVADIFKIGALDGGDDD